MGSAPEAEKGLLNQIIHIAEPRKFLVKIGPEGRFVRMHFLQKPLGMVRLTGFEGRRRRFGHCGFT